MTGAGIPKLRWRIGSLLGAGVLINYFDRISFRWLVRNCKDAGAQLDGTRLVVQRILLDLRALADSR